MVHLSRTSNSLFFSIGIAFCLLALGLMAGCGGSSDPQSAVASVNEHNIQRLANLYIAYQMKHNWQGPPDEQAFKEFLRGFKADKLTRIGIDPNRIDELFISERDGQPFQIRYGVQGNMMGSSEPVIFESEGERGQRMVGFLNMQQREVDDAEYEDLWAGRIQAPQNQRSAYRGS